MFWNLPLVQHLNLVCSHHATIKSLNGQTNCCCIQSLLNQGISFTVRGTLRVLPFLPSVDLEDLTVRLPAVRLIDFSATFRPDAVALDAAFLAVDFALVVAFFAVDLALEITFFAAAFFAVDFALEITFFTAAFFADGFFVAAFLAGDFFVTADNNFFEITALSPALTSPFWPAFTILAGVLRPAPLSFFAVAFPTPGNVIRIASGSFFGLPVISSPDNGIRPHYDEPFSQLGV